MPSCQWRLKTVLFVEQKRARWPPFFLSPSKRNVSRRFWRFLKKKSMYSFLLQRSGVVNPYWDTYKSLQKTVVFNINFRKKRTRWPPIFLLISGIVITQITDTEKISLFLRRIRTGSSYLEFFTAAAGGACLTRVSDLSHDCCQGNGQSERGLKGLWYPDQSRPGGMWFLDHNPLCHIWCG